MHQNFLYNVQTPALEHHPWNNTFKWKDMRVAEQSKNTVSTLGIILDMLKPRTRAQLLWSSENG